MYVPILNDPNKRIAHTNVILNDPEILEVNY